MRKLHLLIASILMTVSLQGIAADTHNHDHDSMKDMQMPMNDKASGNPSDIATKTEAEVRKVNKDQGKITLKHGDIKNLDMPGMTMIFKIKDPAMLNGIASGDKVTFTAERINGDIVVTSLEKIAK
jgi:Cu(I)/Ag(I) efflux system protein CusF